MKNKIVKRLLALALMALMVIPSMSLAFAEEADAGALIDQAIATLFNGIFGENRGSNPKVELPEINLPEIVVKPTAPDNVKEAFSVADDAYAAKHDYAFAVNTSQNIVIAYKRAEDGTYTTPEKAFVCSCGLESSPTKKGTYRTTDTYRWRLLNGNVYGQWATRITGPYLFHSVPYTSKDPSTLETAEYNKLGSNASAGCVRLSVKDAKWIQKHCPEGTLVTIYDGTGVKEPLAKPTALKIDVNSPYAGWDPTDPNERNPWKLG